MRSKIGIFLACMLLIVYIIPFSGLATEINNNTIIFLDNERLPPIPGELPSDFVIETKQVVQTVSNPPKKTLDSTEDAIIQIIENMDEELYLGYLEALVAFGPRPTGSSGCENAADYIYEEFVSDGLEARYDDWSNGGYSSQNVEATLPGIDESSDEIYIICAHYDTVTVSPGADDDGSGTTAVHAAAYLMSQYEFNHTIKFVTFSGEEQGLLGSEAYAAEAYAQGWNIVGVLNADMISYAVTENDGDNLIVFEDSGSEWLYTYTNNVNTEYSSYIDLVLDHGGYTWGSDHNSFWDYGYNALFYFEYTETPYYHQSGDTIAHINTSYAKKNSRLIFATLAELAEAQPLSKPPATPTKPSGPDIWTINVETTFSSTTTDPEGESIFYLFDWGDGTNSGWIGPYNSGQAGSAAHTWINLGQFNVKAIARDSYNVQSGWSESATITIIENSPPAKPTISGPSTGKPGKTINFNFSSTDPEGNDLYYFVYWGDGDYEDWDGPYTSGEEATLGHSWSKAGVYTITAKAMDEYGAKSEPNQVQLKITKSKELTSPVLHQILEKLVNHFPILNYLLNR